jgi:hypothetical protein
LIGGFVGAHLGYIAFGALGAIILAPVLAFAGFRLGSLPLILVLRSEKKKFQKENTQDLIEGLTGKYAYYPNIVLAELRNRGEDISVFLPFLCDLMVSPEIHTRIRGWVALRSALPEYAALIPSYHPSLDQSKCEEIIQKLKGN